MRIISMIQYEDAPNYNSLQNLVLETNNQLVYIKNSSDQLLYEDVSEKK